MRVELAAFSASWTREPGEAGDIKESNDGEDGGASSSSSSGLSSELSIPMGILGHATTKAFGVANSRDTLRNINLKVQPGDLVIVVGPVGELQNCFQYNGEDCRLYI